MLHGVKLTGDKLIQAFQLVISRYRTTGVERFEYKPIPWIYHTQPCQDDLYAFFRLSAKRAACGLSSTVDLWQRRTPSNRRKRSFRKGKKDVTVSLSNDFLLQVWRIVENNLARRHEASPVHSLEEITELSKLFPDNVKVAAAFHGDEVVAGVVIFITKTTWHAQYIAADELGFKTHALDVVFEELMIFAKNEGIRYFDFGTSNENGGMILNSGLYGFKTEFGGGGVVYESYSLDL